jgi:hypothetical protein
LSIIVSMVIDVIDVIDVRRQGLPPTSSSLRPRRRFYVLPKGLCLGEKRELALTGRHGCAGQNRSRRHTDGWSKLPGSCPTMDARATGDSRDEVSALSAAEQEGVGTDPDVDKGPEPEKANV